jgi:hypothetical protein
MKLQDFITTLEQNSNKELLFTYSKDKFVGANYHLTEVKNVQFDTTDCGGKTNFWKETHFQIWESPKEKDKRNYMTTGKILSIIKRVDDIKSINPETELKIEYGNDNFSTSVMPIERINIMDKQIIVSLFSEATRCKANDNCGITESSDKETSCCETVACC